MSGRQERALRGASRAGPFLTNPLDGNLGDPSGAGEVDDPDQTPVGDL